MQSAAGMEGACGRYGGEHAQLLEVAVQRSTGFDVTAADASPQLAQLPWPFCKGVCALLA